MGGPGGYGGGGGGGMGFPGGGFGAPRRDLDTVQLRKQDFTNLPAFEKRFYCEHPAVTARTEEEVTAYRQAREIHVEGTGVPKPVATFDEASFPGAPPACYQAHPRICTYNSCMRHAREDASGCTECVPGCPGVEALHSTCDALQGA